MSKKMQDVVLMGWRGRKQAAQGGDGVVSMEVFKKDADVALGLWSVGMVGGWTR